MNILKKKMKLFFYDETEEEKKERIEKRKKELEKYEEDKTFLVSYKPNGKKVYYKLTEDFFFSFICVRKISIKSTN